MVEMCTPKQTPVVCGVDNARQVRFELRNVSLELRNISLVMRNVSLVPRCDGVLYTTPEGSRHGSVEHSIKGYIQYSTVQYRV